MSMCFVNVSAAEQSANATDGVSANANATPRFTVEEVRAYPAYLNADDGKYHYYRDVYKSINKNITIVWLQLTPETTQSLLKEFSDRGVKATHWFLEIQCNASNYSKPLRYEYRPVSSEDVPKTVLTAYNGERILKYIFPVQDTSETYYDGLHGGFYYRTSNGETGWGFSGALELNSKSSSAE